jgi:hypothetical protein
MPELSILRLALSYFAVRPLTSMEEGSAGHLSPAEDGTFCSRTWLERICFHRPHHVCIVLLECWL